MTTAAIRFNKDEERVVTVRNKTIVRMESALVLWISDCKKNIALDTNITRTKSKKLYEAYADIHNSEDHDSTEHRPSTRVFHAVPCQFNSSKGWFHKFHKRLAPKSVSQHGEAASTDTTEEKVYVDNKFYAAIMEIGYEPDKDINMDETCVFLGNECHLAYL